MGLLDDAATHATAGFKDEGDAIVLLGRATLQAHPSELAGSEYLELIHGTVAGKPAIDLDLEVATQRVCRELIAAGVAKSAHDCSDGGMAVAVAESALIGDIGADIAAYIATNRDAVLFGEGQSRIIVSVAPADMDAVSRICAANNVPWARIGRVGGDTVAFGDHFSLPLFIIADAHQNGLARALSA